jgi:hypothetical protein
MNAIVALPVVRESWQGFWRGQECRKGSCKTLDLVEQ